MGTLQEKFSDYITPYKYCSPILAPSGEEGAYDTLKDDIPAKTFIDTLITPLCCSLPCKLLSASPKLTTSKKWLNFALQLTKWC